MGYYLAPTRDELKLAKHYMKYLKRVGVHLGLSNLVTMGTIKFLGKGAERKVYSIEGIDGFVLKVDRTDYDKCNGFRCRLECYVYREALKEGWEEYFVPAYYLGKIGNTTFSLQYRVNVWEDNAYEKLCEYIDSNPGTFEYYYSYDEDETYVNYAEAISDMSDYEIANVLLDGVGYRFGDFLDNYNVNDLHQGNFGTDEYGNFLIVDYCGYRTSSETPHKW